MAKKKAKSAKRTSKVSKFKEGATESSVVSKWHAVPLKGSFMVLSILGFLISAYLISDKNYRFAFMIVFGVMFVASLVSMAKSPMVSR